MTKDFSIKPYVSTQAGMIVVNAQNPVQTNYVNSSPKLDVTCGVGAELKKGNIFADANANVGTNIVANGKAGYSIPLNEVLSVNLSANAQYAQNIVSPKERDILNITQNLSPDFTPIGEPETYTVKGYTDQIDSFSRTKVGGAVELGCKSKDGGFNAGIGAEYGYYTTSANVRPTQIAEPQKSKMSESLILPTIRCGADLKSGFSVAFKSNLAETHLELKKTF